MTAAIALRNVSKTYATGLNALSDINLDIKRGEIFALLGPNGAGKTTLISLICGIVTRSGGSVTVCGYDTVNDYRAARQAIGLVPQELSVDAFETPWNTATFTRGLYGKAPDPAYIEDLLKRLSLWDKKDTQIRRLSGGMKRRVMIAKALSHQPQVLFLDEPTAGVDVELRKSMWEQVRLLRDTGVTVILTTHYLEEAEEMADRIGVIRKGQLIVTEDKTTLMKKLGKKELVVELGTPCAALPAALASAGMTLSADGTTITVAYGADASGQSVGDLLALISGEGLAWRDINTRQSTLEDIFIQLMGQA